MKPLAPAEPVTPREAVAQPEPVTDDGPDRPAGTGAPSPVELAWAALGLAGLGAIALALPDGPVRLGLLLAFTVAGPGAGIVCQLHVGDRLVAWALAITGSLTVTALVSVAMVWAASWQPLVATVVLLALTGLAGLVGLIRGRRRPPVARPVAVLPARPGLVWALVPPVLLVLAVALWAVTVATADATQIGAYGLTLGLGAPFVVAVAGIGLAFGLELFGRARRSVLAGGVGAVTVAVFATAPLLLVEPEYAWTYKHFGVVEFIQQHGKVLDPADIYQQWPAFFSAAAQLSTVAGVEPIRFAAWSSLFFGLVDALLLAAVVRALTSDRRTIFLSVFLFECCLWVDTNYFSPQAFAFALSLGFFVLLLHWCRGTPTARTGSRLGRLRAALVRGAPEPTPVSDRAHRWALGALLLVFFALTAAHQLTPYLLLFGVTGLAVLGLVRPRLLVVLLAVVALGYFAPRLGGVSSQYHLFDGFDLFKNGAGNAAGWGTPAQEFSALVARALAGVVWLAALFAGWRHRRALGPMAIPLILGFSPFLLLGLQSYGGEAIYRVFLFSLPWCAVAAAAGWWTTGARRPAPIQGLVTGVALAVLTLAGLQGLQGQFALHAMPGADVAAARYLAANAPAGSTLTLVAPAFPARLTANYASINPGRSVDPSIVDEPAFRKRALDADRLPEIESWAGAFGGTATFLAVSDRMAVSTDYFGYLPRGSVAALRTALDASGRWSVFYRAPGITIYRLT